jgi:hypothetical protein
MALPSSRELELETLLRERDSQVVQLTVNSFLTLILHVHHLQFLQQDEITRLRQYLSVQTPPSTSDPITLPPALISILLPHINNASSSVNAPGTSTTVTTALTQRAKLLQEENDELYALLRYGETGQLKEEVRVLRRAVKRLEGALRGSSFTFQQTHPFRSHGSHQNLIQS